MKNFQVISEKENKLFSRKEIEAEVGAEVTPRLVEMNKLLSEKFSVLPENIRIKKIAGKFGSKTFAISANIYNSKEDLKKTEVFSKKEIEKMKQKVEKVKEDEKTEVAVEKVEEKKEKVN